MPPDHHYWFPAKQYGWGWDLPITWQGWAVLLAYIALLVGGGRIFPPRRALPAFLVYVVCLALVLIGILWLKGEPPRWR